MSSRTAAVGIDVAELRKGLDLVGLDRDRNVLASRRRLTIDEVATITLSLRPAVVCVDSPSGWSISGASRAAERQLARLGIQSYRTGPDPGDHPFYRWMRIGFEVFQRLAPVYPLYRGGPVAGRAAEIFPHASACLLAGQLRPRDVPKQRFRRTVLRGAGVPEDQLESPDQVDAALGALTGLLGLEGEHATAGDPDEGIILIPGYPSIMEAVTTIDQVRTFETRGGNARYVVRDVDGNEYTTFREAIGEKALELEGRRVRIEYHEEQRGQYRNVYLDKVEPAPEQERDAADTDAEEAAWRTAVEAAPWLVGDSDPHASTGPEELYETLKPFKDKVAEDIKRSDGDDR